MAGKPRNNGTWSKVYEGTWDHRKTRACAERLLSVIQGSDLDWPSDFLGLDLAMTTVVRMVHRLTCWAIRDGETGDVGHLTDDAFIAQAWPAGLRSGLDPAALRSALTGKGDGSDGFIDVNRRGTKGRRKYRREQIHEFSHHASGIIRHRNRDRTKDGPPPDHKASKPPNRPDIPIPSGQARAPDTRQKATAEAEAKGSSSRAGFVEFGEALRWRGSARTVSAALEDIYAGGVSEWWFLRHLRGLGGTLVGVRPFDAKAKVLEEWRRIVAVNGGSPPRKPIPCHECQRSGLPPNANLAPGQSARALVACYGPGTSNPNDADEPTCEPHWRTNQ